MVPKDVHAASYNASKEMYLYYTLYINIEGCLEPTNPGVLFKKSAKFNFDQMILMLECPAAGFFFTTESDGKNHPLDL